MSIGIFAGATTTAVTANPRVGDLYAVQKAPGGLVQVTHLFRSRSGIPHARVRVLTGSSQNILVSCEAFGDPVSYRPLRRAREE